MMSFLYTIKSVLESWGRARAATHYTRLGNYEAAKKVMQD